MDRNYEARSHALEMQHGWFRTRREAVRARVLQFCQERVTRVLEIGCFSGVFMRELHTIGNHSVVGIDVSAETIAECHRQGTSNARLMDAQRLDFPDDHFDLLTVLDEVKKRPSRVIRDGPASPP